MSESFGRGESALFLQNPELAAAARRQRLAQGLLEQAVKPRNVGGHAGGLAQMGQALIAGYMGYKEDERIRAIADAQRAREEEEVRALMGGGMPAAAPGGQAPAIESALATPPGSLPPPIPLGAEAPPMAQALMNPPGQPGQPQQGGAAPGMPMPPSVPAGGPAPSAAPAMGQPGGGANMQAIIAGMSSSSPRVRATAQMRFQQARDQEERALRAQERAQDRAFSLANRAQPAPTELERLFQEANLPPGAPERVQAARDMIARRGLPPSTNINMPASDTTYDKERAKTTAETVGAWESADTRAATTLDRVARLERLNQRFQTGALANARLTAGQVAQQLNIPNSVLEGLGISKDQTASGEGIRSLTMQLLTAQLGPGGFPTQNFSNADMNALRESLPGLMNTPQGNVVISEVLRAAALRDREIGAAWREWRRANGDNMTSARQFQDERLPSIINNNIIAPLFVRDAEAMGPGDTGGGVSNPRGGFSASPPADLPLIRSPSDAAMLPPGTQFRTPDGRILRVPGQ
jgi:hypothetical protein